MASYCTPIDVAEILGISAWPETGPVTEAVIDKWITRMEDRVDRTIGNSYKKQTAVDEYQNYYAIENRLDTGVPVYLDHNNLFAFDATKGDKIEIWNGTTYTQLGSTGTEGRDSDFWFDLKQGVLFLRLGRGTIVLGVRLTYRYGNYDSIPGDIQDATALLVAARVATLDGTAAVLQSEGRDVPPEERIGLWQREAKATLNSQRGFKSIGALPGVLR